MQEKDRNDLITCMFMQYACIAAWRLYADLVVPPFFSHAGLKESTA
jgi:hypothetical protein